MLFLESSSKVWNWQKFRVQFFLPLRTFNTIFDWTFCGKLFHEDFPFSQCTARWNRREINSIFCQFKQQKFWTLRQIFQKKQKFHFHGNCKGLYWKKYFENRFCTILEIFFFVRCPRKIAIDIFVHLGDKIHQHFSYVNKIPCAHLLIYVGYCTMYTYLFHAPTMKLEWAVWPTAQLIGASECICIFCIVYLLYTLQYANVFNYHKNGKS